MRVLSEVCDGLMVLAVALLVAVTAGGFTVLELTPQAASASHGGGHCQVITHRGVDSAGDENQPLGVIESAEWGWAEVDASVSKDGVVAATHDANMGRLSGGASDAYVWELTYQELWDLPDPYGPIRKTTTLIGRAAALDVPIMVTINSWTQVKAAGYGNATLDTLYAAAQAHPHPGWVYFGGFGAQDAMRNRHPDASTFWRYEHNDTVDWIVANATAEGIELVALPKAKHRASVVNRVEAIPTVDRVTTRQIETADEAQAAQAAGIGTMQGDDAELIATGWCR